MKQTSIRDLLYEPPGPAARKRISILTLARAMAALVPLLDRARYPAVCRYRAAWIASIGLFLPVRPPGAFWERGLLTTLEAAVTGAGIALHWVF